MTMKNFTIKNIIFDIGNVLTDFRWHAFLEDKGFDEAMIQRIARASVESPLWTEFDRGAWPDEKLMKAFVERDPQIEEQLHRAYDDIHGMVTPREYAIPWIKQLKKNGYQVLYLSNFSKKAQQECGDALAFVPYTDGGILSYREKLIKPEPAIYRLMIQRFGLVPEESVFIDDTPKNVAGAVAAGMHGIVFQTKEQTEEELGKLGVKILP